MKKGISFLWFVSAKEQFRFGYRQSKILTCFIFIIKFGHNGHCHWLKERILYQSTKYGAEPELSCHLPICTMRDHFLDFSLAFFRQLMRNFGTSEPASSNEKTKQRFANMPKAVFDVTVT